MAPTLIGAHAKYRCESCDFEFAVNFEKELSPQSTCPNCGRDSAEAFIDKANDRVQVFQGDRVFVDELVYKSESPKRFDVVALHDPNRENEFIVKRIFGLPDEKIEFRQGDLFVNGKIFRKSIEFQKALSHFVYKGFQRKTNNRWELLKQGFRYNHLRTYETNLKKNAPIPIQDNYIFNSKITRELFDTGDIALLLNCELEMPKSLNLRIHNRFGWAEVILDFENSNLVFLFNGKQLARKESKKLIKSSMDYEIFVSSFDRQISLDLNGEQFQIPISDSMFENGNPISINSPVEIKFNGKTLNVKSAEIRRDIFLLDQFGGKSNWKSQCGVAHYLVLGDNLPISKDSRHWAKPAVSADQIIGQVLFESRLK